MVYNTLVPKMTTNFDKYHGLKASTSNLYGEEFLKPFCISVIRRATKLCFMYYLFMVILFNTVLCVFSAYFLSKTRYFSFCVSVSVVPKF